MRGVIGHALWSSAGIERNPLPQAKCVAPQQQHRNIAIPDRPILFHRADSRVLRCGVEAVRTHRDLGQSPTAALVIMGIPGHNAALIEPRKPENDPCFAEAGRRADIRFP